jgi:DNA-binding winged helix-turn-helix (wHTH) protein/predicted ATPase
MKVFHPFRLDAANHCLWRSNERVALPPKAFDVLRFLVDHAGRLVTQEEILETLWPEAHVNPEIIKKYILIIRKALGDSRGQSIFIETISKRGYKFVAPISNEGSARIDPFEPEATVQMVGRRGRLAQLDTCLAKTLRGQRQVVFVIGEAGIGKTALVDAFARSAGSDRTIRVSRGQCLEQYGTAEAYLPFLEAIGRLCREDRSVVDQLRTHAPLWLLQLPSLISASQRESLNREIAGATRERMLREMVETLEVLTADRALVLILEDLHWSDYSTVDLISYLAKRREPTRLMLIGTYRPVDLEISEHPLKALKRELLAKGECEDLPLEYLGQGAVAEYLAVRFPHHKFPAELPALIHARTGGNALFMVSAVSYLLHEQLITQRQNEWVLSAQIERVEVGVPDSIKQMTEKQLGYLNQSKQRLLEVASVAGEEFSTQTVAAGLGDEQTLIERHCDELARAGQFLRTGAVHVLPDGEVATKFGFIHALYRNVLYQRILPSRRAELHLRIGTHEESLYGASAGEIAAELAMHFECGRDYKRAAKYLRKAADNALRRFAFPEAISLARRGLELLSTLPDSQERAEIELSMQVTLGLPLIATQGYAAPDVGRAYLRAQELAQQVPETPDAFKALWGLWTFHLLRAELETSRKIAEELLHLGERLSNPSLTMRGRYALEITLTHLGEFALALKHFDKAVPLYDPTRHRDDGFMYALNLGVAMPCAAWALWFLGEPDQAVARIQEALTLARTLSEPMGLAHALFFAAILHQLRREASKSQEYAEMAIAISKEHQLPLYEAMATIVRGWSLIQQGGRRDALSEMRKGLATLQSLHTKLLWPHFLTLVFESLDGQVQLHEGLPMLDEALGWVERNGDQYYQAELYRLKGDLLLRPGGQAAEAEYCFDRAVEIAQRQGAKSLELRSTMSIARLRQRQSREIEGRDLLARICNQFDAGLDTEDLRQAKELQHVLSSPQR